MSRPIQYHNGVPWSPTVPTKIQRKIKKVVTIDSRDRVIQGGATDSNGMLLPLNSSYSVQLPDALKNVISVKLISAEIPISFYQFNSSTKSPFMIVNGTLSFKHSNGSTLTASVDGSFSTASALGTAVAAAMNTAASVATYSASVSATTGLLTITNSAVGFTIYPATGALSTNTDWGLAYYLGLLKAGSYTTAAAGSITGSCPVVFQPYKSLLMELNLFNKVDETSTTNRSGNKDAYFAKIPIVGSTPFTNYYFPESSNFINQTTLNPPLNKLQTLNVTFRFHDGSRPYFWNAEHSFTLEFEILEGTFDDFSSVENGASL
jgi:hypothetical protein